MNGSAITEVQIDGVEHEYTTIEGVQEDVIDILLNLKNVSVLMHNQEDAYITCLSKDLVQLKLGILLWDMISKLLIPTIFYVP